MDRRHLLRAASIGVGSSLAGCLEWFESSASDDGTDDVPPAIADCELEPFERLDEGWSVVRDTERIVTAEGFADGEAPVKKTLHSFDGRIHLELALPEILCCRLRRPIETDSQDTRGPPPEEVHYLFFDADTGDELWRCARTPAPDAGAFAPLDGTTAHDETVVRPVAIADDLVYLYATYTAEAYGETVTLTSGLFALDATDGTIKWSRPVSPVWPYMELDRLGRLYVAGTSNALTRADPADRPDSIGDQLSESERAPRIHARALNARTGEVCWDWATSLPDSEESDGDLTSYGVVGGQVATRLTRDTDPLSPPRHTLLCIDADTGEEYTSVAYRGRQRGAAAADGRLVILTEEPPIEPVTEEPLVGDAPADGETLFAVDPERGEIDWMIPAPGDRIVDAGAGVVFVLGDVLVGVDPASGDVRWEFDRQMHSVVPTDDVVLLAPVSLGGDAFAGVDPETGETLWEVDEGEGILGIAGETLVTTELELPGEREEPDVATDLLVRSLDTGEIVTRLAFEGEGGYADAIAADGRLFFTIGRDDEPRLVSLS